MEISLEPRLPFKTASCPLNNIVIPNEVRNPPNRGSGDMIVGRNQSLVKIIFVGIIDIPLIKASTALM